jgi:hypothetical protein
MGCGSRRSSRGPALFSAAEPARAVRSRRCGGCWRGPPHPPSRGVGARRRPIPVLGSFTNIWPFLCRRCRLFNLYQFSTDAFLKCLRRACCCSALILHAKTQRRLPILTAFWVNAQVAYIFNGVFETRKSTRNEEKFAESCVRRTRRAVIYHARINHDAALREANGLLRHVCTADARSLSPRGEGQRCAVY